MTTAVTNRKQDASLGNKVATRENGTTCLLDAHMGIGDDQFNTSQYTQD